MSNHTAIRSHASCTLVLLAVTGCPSEPATETDALGAACRAVLERERDCSDPDASDAELEEAAAQQCGMYEQWATDLGEPCRDSMIARLECRSQRSCDVEAGSLDCADVDLDNATACPELFGLCYSMSFSGGGQTCATDFGTCADQSEYRVDCVDGTCTCMRDRVAGREFTTEDCDAIQADPEPFLSAACEWPALWQEDDAY